MEVILKTIIIIVNNSTIKPILICFFLLHLESISMFRYMIAYTNLLRCIENLGIAGAYGIRYYGQGKITHDNYVQLIRHFTLVDEYLEQSKNYVPQIGKGKKMKSPIK